MSSSLRSSQEAQEATLKPVLEDMVSKREMPKAFLAKEQEYTNTVMGLWV